MFPLILPLNAIFVVMALRPQHVMHLYMDKYVIDIYLDNVMVFQEALLRWYCTLCNEYIWDRMISWKISTGLLYAIFGNISLGLWMGRRDVEAVVAYLTLVLLTWRIWWANNASKWQTGFNSAFKGLNICCLSPLKTEWNRKSWEIELSFPVSGIWQSRVYGQRLFLAS